MAYKKFLLFVLLVYRCLGAIERDLLLTPSKNSHITGRTLYYNPANYEIGNGTVPWEATLKHVTFLTLFAGDFNNTELSNLREYKEFMHASYTRVHEEYPRFGDIITMAIGWLDNSNGYSFKEGVCEDDCIDNALALWRVQKIRHRDPQSGFRYEMKFSVTPLNTKINLQSPHNGKYYKTFILKDNLYPNSFNTIKRRSDSIENFSNERQARIVNFDPRQEINHMPALNIGEFFKNVPKASSKVGYLSSSRNDLPTTYRPNYRGVNFARPQVYEAPQEEEQAHEEEEEQKTLVTHHFHHHYFMNGIESTKNHDDQLYHGRTPDAIRIIDPPSVELLSPRYVLTTSTTKAPPAHVVLYNMQQIPQYIQSFPREDTTTQRPFRQSEQQFEEIRYSEPDPLYANVDESSNQPTAEFTSKESQHNQVERPSSEAQSSSIEQLSQPAEDYQATHIPYLISKAEATTTTTTTTTSTTQPTTLAPSSTRRTLLPKNKFFVTPPPSSSPTESSSLSILESPKPKPIAVKLSQGNRKNIRSTTETPVLKWKPKRRSKNRELPPVQDKTDTTEDKVVTVTPSKAEFEVLTQKSVSKSISVKVGNVSREISFIDENSDSDSRVFLDSGDSSDSLSTLNES